MASSREPPPEIRGGHTYQYTAQDSDNHLWVEISDPLRDENHILVVTFTTYRPWKDGTCRIQPGEHEFVTEETCVQYLACGEVKLGVLEEWLDSGRIATKKPVSPELLRRIREGAFDSNHTPGFAKKILVDQELVIPW